VAADQPATILDWAAGTALTGRIARTIAAEEVPDLVIGILRGGMIPAIWLAHAMGVREVRALDVTHTASDIVNADKTPCPILRNPASLGDLTGLDILLVDDVAGTGDTMRASRNLAANAGARNLRTVVWVLNETNWQRSGGDDPAATFTCIGATYRGWVVFPWETR
jgi:uncharacterized protein